MVKNNIKKKESKAINKKNIKNYDDKNINNFLKNGFFTELFSGMSVLKYKFIVYWLPIILYVFIISFYIFITQTDSEWIIAFISGLLIYILYFLIDIIYQNIICDKISFGKSLKNSAINALTPAIFVLSGYIFACILRDVKNCNISYNDNSGIESSQHLNKNNTDTTRLINIHRNNVIVSIAFYVFSIIYNNPINKKKCINNKLC